MKLSPDVSEMRVLAANKAVLEAMHKRFEAGDKAVLLHAIAHAFNDETPPPEWVRREYLNAFGRWVGKGDGWEWDGKEVRTLDEAFSVKFPKGKSLAAVCKRQMLMGKVFSRVVGLHRDGKAIDEALFETVGREFSIGASTARDYYYAIQKIQDEWLVARHGADALKRKRAQSRRLRRERLLRQGKT